MKKIPLLLTLSSLLSLGLFAAEKQEVTLEGTGMCAKCELGEATKCTNVIQVTKEDGELVNYLFTNNMKHGEFFCMGKTEGLIVKGTLAEHDGEMKLTATSVEKKEG